ncbi:MAG: hypothetical protein OES47_08455 [Acidobacteriota bacterium]|nr:hypothetical protein [Acidobacteriota bacterium]
MAEVSNKRNLPLWLKVAFTAWLAVWVPAYWVEYGWQNFLWTCDAANFVVLAALWLESPLLIASQAVSVLVISSLWVVDFGAALLFGTHPIGGTEYMFDPAKPLATRLLSLFHVVVPILLLWCIRRMGYDRRGWRLQVAIIWLLLLATHRWTEPAKNINWQWLPFGIDPPILPPAWILPVSMLAMPVVLYLPTHAALVAWSRKFGRYHE